MKMESLPLAWLGSALSLSLKFLAQYSNFFLIFALISLFINQKISKIHIKARENLTLWVRENFFINCKKYFWSKLKRYVTRHGERWHICQRSKVDPTNTGLYSPHPTRSALWNLLFVYLVNKSDQVSSNSGGLIFKHGVVPFRKAMDASHVVKLYFKEIFRLHGAKFVYGTFLEDFVEGNWNWGVC